MARPHVSALALQSRDHSLNTAAAAYSRYFRWQRLDWTRSLSARKRARVRSAGHSLAFHVPETNVRTYVLGPDGKPGVWFYTLEADRLPAVLAARSWYKLAYRWADMRISSENQTVEYKSTRSSLFGKGSTDIAVEVGDEMPTGDLDHFLTARFRLYAAHRSRIAYANIQHPTWPLRHARITRLEEDLIFHSGVPAPVGEPLVHFSRELHVTAQTLRWF